MQLPRKNICPLLKKQCIGLDCMLFMKIEGPDPQNKDRHIEEWGCAIAWNVVVGVQIAKDVRNGTSGIQAATESFRNQMVQLNMVVLDPMQEKPLLVIGGDDDHQA